MTNDLTGISSTDIQAMVDEWVGNVLRRDWHEDRDSARTGQLMRALVKAGERAIPHLVPVLKHEDWIIGADAAMMLGYIRSPKAVPALLDALQQCDPAMKVSVACALETIGTPDATHAAQTWFRENHIPAQKRLWQKIPAYGSLNETDPRLMERLIHISQRTGFTVRQIVTAWSVDHVANASSTTPEERKMMGAVEISLENYTYLEELYRTDDT